MRGAHGLRLRLLIVLGAVTLLASIIVPLVLLRGVADRDRRHGVLVEEIVAQRSAFVALLDEETGFRGYVATGEPFFLEPYRSGRAQYRHYRAQAAPDADAGTRGFLRSADAVQRYFTRDIARVARGDREAAVANLNAGKAAFDALRRADASNRTTLRAALDADRVGRSKAVGIAALVVVTAVLWFVSVGSAIGFLIVKARASAALARIDDLTGLLNRRALSERLAAVLASRRGPDGFAVLYVDLDGFKSVNDRFGHDAGDAVLRACAQRLRAAVRPQDIAARVGGDEFVALLAAADPTEVTAIADRIRSRIEAPIGIGPHATSVGASIGMAMVPQDATDVNAILRAADQAMYRDKLERRADGRLVRIGAAG